MSFEFKWPKFSSSFYDHAKDLLTAALNKGEKPTIIADLIQVNHLDMGTIPPDLEILEIGDLGRDRFRGIFRMTYSGDASICLQTKVQANPLRQISTTTTPDILTTPPILFASTPLIVPMTLRLSSLQLRAIVVLVISRLEGVTLVFKNDPLESVQVSSTFDSLATIQNFLQSEIERQLRDLFRTELPGIIHQLSRKWLHQNHSNNPSGPSHSPSIPIIHPNPVTTTPSSSVNNPTLTHNLASVPDQIESYDPTYGLRPSHPPLVGNFNQYRSLLRQKNQIVGLGAVLAQTDDETDDEASKPSVISIDPPHLTSPTPTELSKTNSSIGENRIPKPKIFHSHSAGLIRSDLLSSSSSYYGAQTDSHVTPRKYLFPHAYGTPGPSGKSQSMISKEDEGQILRNRRMERFPIHTPSVSSGAPRATGTNGLQTDSSAIEPSRVSRSTMGSPRAMRLTRPPSSLFSSLHHSSSTSLPPYSSLNCDSIKSVKTCQSPIFLTSRSTTTDEEQSDENFELFNEVEKSPQCALLASLVRGNWTLSPFSRSISHYAARSTPLIKSTSNLSPIAQRAKSNVQNDYCNSQNHDTNDCSQRNFWNDENLVEFKQKRVTKIGRKSR
ncbi:hypothetical protein O181_012054 [Austropuccinia psidii MF-1]|uniref:Mitochondrial distribution and morphology protein 34 n=1 Tax=Austropuccinia psidii MF-1 TaxID=1389203 RepID=A0A9Q3BVN0_9BASI|nr:hypothetical protein [Austropuccinia psidii MF-1]